MNHAAPHPLDLKQTRYSYLERSNPATVALFEKHIVWRNRNPRIVDLGCGCAVNDQAFRERAPGAYILGVEPDPRAAEIARRHCDDVFEGVVQDWLSKAGPEPFDLVVMSDVLEHIADPVAFLQTVGASPQLRSAQWIISVPNYGVWYNRVRSLLGLQGYAWSGLWDRTHLRFFTRSSVAELLDYCGFEVLDVGCTPSIVQSAAPLLRRAFEKDVQAGEHLALAESPAYEVYRKAVEPIEAKLCGAWPSLLGFQIVQLARLR
jgi:predicted TPR repeat methyltransferase